MAGSTSKAWSQGQNAVCSTECPLVQPTRATIKIHMMMDGCTPMLDAADQGPAVAATRQSLPAAPQHHHPCACHLVHAPSPMNLSQRNTHTACVTHPLLPAARPRPLDKSCQGHRLASTRGTPQQQLAPRVLDKRPQVLHALPVHDGCVPAGGHLILSQ